VFRQRSEQYLTLAQSRAHFLRHAKGLPHWMQILVGKSAFERIFGMMAKDIVRQGAPVNRRKANCRRKTGGDKSRKPVYSENRFAFRSGGFFIPCDPPARPIDVPKNFGTNAPQVRDCVRN
jgi:hypothetical protein